MSPAEGAARRPLAPVAGFLLTLGLVASAPTPAQAADAVVPVPLETAKAEPWVLASWGGRVVAASESHLWSGTMGAGWTQLDGFSLGSHAGDNYVGDGKLVVTDVAASEVRVLDIASGEDQRVGGHR